jgi:hypothetical protein
LIKNELEIQKPLISYTNTTSTCLGHGMIRDQQLKESVEYGVSIFELIPQPLLLKREGAPFCFISPSLSARGGQV